MKIYGIYVTDNWETKSVKDYIGYFSTLKLAKKQVNKNLNNFTKVVIEEITIDEIDNIKKLVVFEG